MRKIEPAVFPEIERVLLGNGREVIVLRISGSTGLYLYDGRPYYRLGPTTSVMPRDLYGRWLMEGMGASHQWENWPAEGFSIHDLDEREIVRTIEEAIRRQRMDDPGTRNPEELLLGLGLIDGGKLVNAAVVLFGRADRLMPRYMQCLLRMARFRGTTKREFEVGSMAFDRADRIHFHR